MTTYDLQKAWEFAKKLEANKGAPEFYVNREKIDVAKINDVITIDNITIKVTPKFEKKNGNYVKTEDGRYKQMVNKKGEIITKTTIFVGFDGDKYFATNSAPMCAQLKAIFMDDYPDFDKNGALFDIHEFNGSKVRIVTTPVKYTSKNGDEKEYDRPIFANA